MRIMDASRVQQADNFMAINSRLLHIHHAEIYIHYVEIHIHHAEKSILLVEMLYHD